MKRRLSRGEVLPAANKLLVALRPVCEMVMIAGSLRRKTATVSDIEIVALPLVREVVAAGQIGLFDQALPTANENLLDAKLAEMIDRGLLRITPPPGWDARTAWGEKYRKLWIPTPTPDPLPAAGAWVQVDLFIADAKNWGAIATIRTGPGEFSQSLVTRIKDYTPYRQHEGYLVDMRTGKVVPVADEREYFLLAGVQWVEPEQRLGARSVKPLPVIRRSTRAQRTNISEEIDAETTLQARLAEVVNIRDCPAGWQYDRRYVYIGRASRAKGLKESPWANPYRIGNGKTRANVIQAYRERLGASPELQRRIAELEGKRLVCWCAPLACHGDVLAEYVERHVRGEGAAAG